MKALRVFGITGVLLFSWAPAALGAKPLYPIQSMKACDEGSAYQNVELKDFSQNLLKVQWTDSAAESCPGAAFPRIVLRHAKAQAFVHIVRTDVAVPEEFLKNPSWNLLGKGAPWVFLDVAESDRTAQNLFYSMGMSFHDNPKWQVQNLKWVGHVYGVSQDKRGIWAPVLGVSWGFWVKDSKVQAIRAQGLSAQDWEKDKAALGALQKHWKKFPRLK